MCKYFCIVILVSLLIKTGLYAQSELYIVKPTPFSSRIYNEFSPVFYKGGIVFCSDQNDNSLVSYKGEQNRLFKIFFVTKKGSSGWTLPKYWQRKLQQLLMTDRLLSMKMGISSTIPGIILLKM